MLHAMGNRQPIAVHTECSSAGRTSFFSVIDSVLRIDHVLCQESVIHALGHLRFREPETCTQLLNGFIESMPTGHPLTIYAQEARDSVIE